MSSNTDIYAYYYKWLVKNGIFGVKMLIKN